MTSRYDGNVLHLQLPTTTATGQEKYRLPQPGPGELFLKGPIPWKWMTTAGMQKGRTLQVAVALWLAASLERNARVSLPSSFLRNMGVDRFAAARGLDALEKLGLVTVERASGRKAIVTLHAAPAERAPVPSPGTAGLPVSRPATKVPR